MHRRGERKRRLVAWGVLAFVVLTGIAWFTDWERDDTSAAERSEAAPVAVGSIDLGASEWREFEPPFGNANTFVVSGPSVLEVFGDSAASLRWRTLDFDVPEDLIMSWKWKVDSEPIPMNLASSASDRPIAVMVGFAHEESSPFARFVRALPFLPDDMPGRTLMYVWGGTHHRGDVLDGPYPSIMPGHLLICRPGGSPLGEWFKESVALADDYLRLFGEKPTKITHLAIAADSDNSESESRAFLSNLRLHRSSSGD